jgi:hypothetical protein
VDRIRASVSVTTSDPEILRRAMEAFSRCASGLAMEGVDTFQMTSVDEDDT